MKNLNEFRAPLVAPPKMYCDEYGRYPSLPPELNDENWKPKSSEKQFNAYRKHAMDTHKRAGY